MKFTKTQDYILVPEQSYECVDVQCYNLFANHNVLLYPDRINKINPGFHIELPSYQVLQIKPHTCNKPWRILGEYLYPEEDNTLIIPVITDTKCMLNIGDVLCHIQPISLAHAFLRAKCKSYIYFILLCYLLYLLYFTLFTLITILNVLAVDEIYFSEDDDINLDDSNIEDEGLDNENSDDDSDENAEEDEVGNS